MMSGPASAMQAVLPMISLWGQNVTVAGEKPGAAQVLKLVNNMLVAVSIIATSEAMVMGTKAGLDPEVMLAGINAGSGRNGASLSLFGVHSYTCVRLRLADRHADERRGPCDLTRRKPRRRRARQG